MKTTEVEKEKREWGFGQVRGINYFNAGKVMKVESEDIINRLVEIEEENKMWNIILRFPMFCYKGVEKALFKTLPERHHSLIPLNMEALKEGAKIIEEVK